MINTTHLAILATLVGWTGLLIVQYHGDQALSSQTRSAMTVIDNLSRECSAKSIVRDSTFTMGEFSSGPALHLAAPDTTVSGGGITVK